MVYFDTKIYEMGYWRVSILCVQAAEEPRIQSKAVGEIQKTSRFPVRETARLLLALFC